MHTLEVNLKHSPLPLMIQKESLEAAQADYQRIADALSSGNPVNVEMSCDMVTDKKVNVIVSEIAAVQIYEKSGTASASGKPPGFFALMGEGVQS